MEKERWYFKNYVLVIMFLTIGPLMLPLVWRNPKFTKKNKIIITLLVIILTFALICTSGYLFIAMTNHLIKSLSAF